MATTQTGNRGTRKAAATKAGSAANAGGAKKRAVGARASSKQSDGAERGRKAPAAAGAKKGAARNTAAPQASARKAATRPAAASKSVARPAARNEAARKTPAAKGVARKGDARKTGAKVARAGTGRGRARPLDAIELLKQDHERVEKLIKQFERLKKRDGDDADKTEVARRICEELTLHAQIEEEIFYPAMRESLGKDEDLVDEAKVEHDSAKSLMAQVQGAQAGDPMFDAYVTVLGEYVRHHVEEEEGEMFKKAKRAKVDMVELGERIAQRKAALQDGGAEADGADAGAAGGLGQAIETAGQMAGAVGVAAADTAASVIGAFAGSPEGEDRS